MITVLLFICLIILLFQVNIFFTSVFSIFIYVYMRMAKAREFQKKQNAKSLSFPQPSANGGIKSLMMRYTAGFVRYFDYRLSRVPSHHFRIWMYRYVYLMDIDKTAVVYYGAQIRKPFKIKIGKGSIIGDCAILDGRNGIEIGNNVTFASNVSIWTEQHDHRDPYFRCETQPKEKVVIGDRAWIGPNTIILHSANIGTGAVVAAGAVVTKTVEPFCIVGGIPAKIIGERNRDLRYNRNNRVYTPFL